MRLATRAWWLLVGMVTTSVLIAVLAGWIAARHILLAEFDTVLTHRAERVAAAAAALRGSTLPEPASQSGQFLVRLIDGCGRILFAQGEPWPEALAADLPRADGISTRVSGRGAVLRVVRISGVRLEPVDGRGEVDDHASVIAAMDATALHRNLSRLTLLLATIAACAVGSALLVAGVMRDGILAPVNRLGAAIDGLPPDDLAARLETGAMPVELRQVAERIDLLLERLAIARARERRTVADIAHELRTPLAALRSELEFATRSGDFTAARLNLLADQVAALQQRTDKLLLASRLDAGTQQVTWQEVSFADLVTDAWAIHAPSAGGRKANFELDDPDDTVVPGDPALLAVLIRNLIANAIAHGADGALRVAVRRAGEQTVWSFANRVVGLEPGDRSQAFEPFWRQDRSRSGIDRHSGLGLSVVQRIVEAHGAQISAAVVDAWFIVTVRWPVAPAVVASRA